MFVQNEKDTPTMTGLHIAAEITSKKNQIKELSAALDEVNHIKAVKAREVLYESMRKAKAELKQLENTRYVRRADFYEKQRRF